MLEFITAACADVCYRHVHRNVCVWVDMPKGVAVVDRACAQSYATITWTVSSIVNQP